jgi:hypothetical protein
MSAPAIETTSPIESAYTAALKEARASGYRLGAEGIARLRRMFGQAIQDLTRQLATVGDDQVTKERATVLREQIEQTLRLIELRIAELTQETAQATAEAVVAIHREVNLDLARTYRNDLVPDFAAAFNAIQARAVTAFAARSQNAATYKTLARRNVKDAAPALDNLLGSAIARGVSSGRLTKDVAALLVGGTPDLKTYGLQPTDVSGLRTLLSDARRIAVTETNNALREGNRMGLLASPIVKAVKWQVSGRHESIPGLAPDECDDLAQGNDAEDLAELGALPPGYYSPKRFPLAPHPYCACVQGGPTIFYRPSEWGRLLGKKPPEPIDEVADANLVAILKEKVLEERPNFGPQSASKIATTTARELLLDHARVVRLLERARRELAAEDHAEILARAKELIAAHPSRKALAVDPVPLILVQEFGILPADAARITAEAEHELKLAQVTDQQLFEAAKERLAINGGLKGDAVVFLVETFKVPGERAIAAVDRALNVLAQVTDEQLVERAIAELRGGMDPLDVIHLLQDTYKVSFTRADLAEKEAERRLGSSVDWALVFGIVKAEVDSGVRNFLIVLAEVQRRISKFVDRERVRTIYSDLVAQANALARSAVVVPTAATAPGREAAQAARVKLAEVKVAHDAEINSLQAEKVALLQEITRLDLAIDAAQRAAKATGAAGVDLNLLPEVVSAGEKVDAVMERMRAIEDQAKTVASRRREAAYAAVEVKQDPKRQGKITFGSRVDAKRAAVWQRGIDVLRRLVPPDVLDGFVTEIKANRGQRAFYRTGDGAFISKHDDFGTVVHELGHAIEYYRPEILRQSIAWRESRTIGEREVTMRSLFPRSGYKASERTKKDKFFSPYVGKTEYGSTASEVLSMGLEAMANDPIDFAEKDPDMFDYIFSVLRSVMDKNPPKRGRIS